MSRFHILLALAVVLAGCGYDPSELGPEELGALARPIVNGATDSGHPTVGMLTTEGYGICTATLVGSRTVLTAAHCVVKEKQAPYSLQPQMGWSPDAGATIIPAAAVVFHPGYDGTALKNDAAVIRLTQDVNIQPMRVASSAPVQGESITLVGYGYTADGASSTFGTKRKATNSIGKVTATEIVFYGATGSVGNICNGDSGGPAFAQRGGEEVLAGIHSWGEGVCGVAEHDARADVHHAWIKQQAQGNLFEGTPSAPQDAQPPRVQFIAPGPQAQLGPSFQVQVAAQDDVAVARVELFLDGSLLQTLEQGPFTFPVDSLTPGPHNLRAEAVDGAGHRASTLITVTVQDGASNLPPSTGPTPDPGTSPASPGADPSQERELVGACNMAHARGGALPLPLFLLLGLALLRRQG